MKLELNTKIISNFKAEINGCIVNHKDVYYTVSDILEYIINTDIPFTKYQDFDKLVFKVNNSDYYFKDINSKIKSYII